MQLQYLGNIIVELSYQQHISCQRFWASELVIEVDLGNQNPALQLAGLLKESKRTSSARLQLPAAR